MYFGVTLFTGVPGIGKSLFLVYFLFRFLHDNRFLDKTFALEFYSTKKYLCFHPTADPKEFLCTHQSGSGMPAKNFLLLCDIVEAAEPASRAQWTFIFSSPAPSRYKEILKRSPRYRYIMPTWSELELMFLNSNIEQWYENFVVFGGVPRYVIPNSLSDINPYDTLQQTLAENGGIIAEEFFKSSFRTIDLLQNYTLVHINPPVSGDGSFNYGGAIVYSFASDYIFQWLVEKHNAQMLAGAVGMFNSGAALDSYGAVSAGHLFEKICLWLQPLDNHCITAASLGSDAAITFTVPATRLALPHDWKKTGQLPENILIVPRISNLESGDAFCVVERMLVVFQVTVAKSHPVKVNGLRDILLAFPEHVRANITQKLVVFVIPKHGTLDKEQALHTQKGEQVVSMPRIVNDFQQYVYRHEIKG